MKLLLQNKQTSLLELEHVKHNTEEHNKNEMTGCNKNTKSGVWPGAPVQEGWAGRLFPVKDVLPT